MLSGKFERHCLLSCIEKLEGVLGNQEKILLGFKRTLNKGEDSIKKRKEDIEMGVVCMDIC